MRNEKANTEKKAKGERKEEVRKNEEEKTAKGNGNGKPYRKGGHDKAETNRRADLFLRNRQSDRLTAQKYRKHK